MKSKKVIGAVLGLWMLPSIAFCCGNINSCANTLCQATICGDVYTWCCDCPGDTGAGGWSVSNGCNNGSVVTLGCYQGG